MSGDKRPTKRRRKDSQPTGAAAGRAASAANASGRSGLSSATHRRSGASSAAAAAAAAASSAMAAPPRRPPSARVRARDQRQMDALRRQAAERGGASDGHSSNSLDALMAAPLERGLDGRQYTTRPIRRRMQRQIEASRETVDRLEDSAMPAAALALRDQARAGGRGSARVSSRSAADGYRTGEDYTFTENRGAAAAARSASDTPRPRSPEPASTGEDLPGRYEQAHQSAFRFTGQPGSTVWAPTQGNQVSDTAHEQFAASAADGFTFRHDTYEASSMYSARPTDDGRWQVQHSSYLRRQVASPSAAPASAAAAPAAPRPRARAAPRPSRRGGSSSSSAAAAAAAAASSSSSSAPSSRGVKRKRSGPS